jgi:hypothetical protein
LLFWVVWRSDISFSKFLLEHELRFLKKFNEFIEVLQLQISACFSSTRLSKSFKVILSYPLL